MAEQSKAKPAFGARAGLVRATVWPNETKDGIRYNVTFSRRYKDAKDGDTWKSTEGRHHKGQELT